MFGLCLIALLAEVVPSGMTASEPSLNTSVSLLQRRQRQPEYSS